MVVMYFFFLIEKKFTLQPFMYSFGVYVTPMEY